MILINLPAAPSVDLPSEPKSRASLLAVPSGPKTEQLDPASRRLSRRVQSLAVAQLSRQASPDVTVDPLTGAPLENRTDLKALKYDIPNDIVVPTFAESSRDVDRDLARLYEAVSGARRIAVICGAGISVSSPANIPDFRSAHGLFKKLKEKHPTAGLSSGKDLFDARLFSSESTSCLFYSMVAELKRLADEAEPTIFHRFLKRLDDEGRLQRVYTQNIDGLEQKAGLTFGLGEAGDATTTVRALGKRKRFGESANAWSRSKSDSHVLFAQKQDDEEMKAANTISNQPMFPRTIPLHGTLQTLTCALCSHKVILGNTVRHDRGATLPPTSTSREGPIALGHKESVHALQLLQSGEAVPCPRCETADEVRTTAGMRSRGVGRMKVDIVLYGGQNEGAERVGQCLQRDILGLRDPYEPSVPESAAETRARERKEKKQAAKSEQDLLETVLEIDNLQQEASADSGLVLPASDSKDDILARAFGHDDDEVSVPSGKSITIVEPTLTARKKASRPPRLKPLPPDLLIVAGTSLKVPGTKRIVREFAKACHAQDEWLVYSSDDDEEGGSSASEDTTHRRPKRAVADKAKPNGDAIPEEDRVKAAEDDELHDPSTPIRSILLNYDFPNPAREWEDVFDVWIQGDLQRAALSLFPAKVADSKASGQTQAIESVVNQHTWSKHKPHLEEQRKLAKKNNAKKTMSTAANSGNLLGQRKGKLGRTVSAAAKMERTGSNASTASQASSAASAKPITASNGATALARSKSVSPTKKRPAVVPGTGLKRTSSSKKNPFATAGSEGTGKGHDGGTRAKQPQKKEVSPSPSLSSTPSLSSRATSTSGDEPEPVELTTRTPLVPRRTRQLKRASSLKDARLDHWRTTA